MMLQNLDDRSYADLVAEARNRIPGLAPAWTDHNPTDPGIVLVELLAWLTEMLIYRADQVPEASYEAFLKLLNGPAWSRSGDLDTAIRETLLALRGRYRAATADDFERLALDLWPQTEQCRSLGSAGAIGRAHCVPQRNLDAADKHSLASGHVSLVVVPNAESDAPQPTATLLEALRAWLEPRRLLGVRHHIVGPGYLPVTINARLVLRGNYAPLTTAQSGILSNPAIVAEAKSQAIAAIRAYFHPLTGGADGRGWPFGRNVYCSEIYQLLDQLPGVDFVEGVAFVEPAPDRQIKADTEVVGLRLYAHELVSVAISNSFTVEIGTQSRGRR